MVVHRGKKRPPRVLLARRRPWSSLSGPHRRAGVSIRLTRSATAQLVGSGLHATRRTAARPAASPASNGTFANIVGSWFGRLRERYSVAGSSPGRTPRFPATGPFVVYLEGNREPICELPRGATFREVRTTLVRSIRKKQPARYRQLAAQSRRLEMTGLDSGTMRFKVAPGQRQPSRRRKQPALYVGGGVSSDPLPGETIGAFLAREEGTSQRRRHGRRRR